MAGPEHDTRQPGVLDVEHRVVQQEQIGPGLREILGERQPRHQGADNEDADEEAPEQAGEDPQGALGQNNERRPRRLEALGDQIAADREEHEDAGEPENRLPAGQHHQRIMVLRILRQQEGVREDHGERRHQPQQVEIVAPFHAAPLPSGDNARAARFIHRMRDLPDRLPSPGE